MYKCVRPSILNLCLLLLVIRVTNGKLAREDVKRLFMDGHELLCAVADFAHGRCTKLLGFRAKVTTLTFVP